MRTPWWIALAGLTLAICILFLTIWGEYPDTGFVFHFSGDPQIIKLVNESGEPLGEISFQGQDQVRILLKRRHLFGR